MILGLVALFFLEQIFYWLMFVYPYRYGILIRTISIPQLEISFWLSTRPRNLSVKIDRTSGYIYLRYRYSFGAFGPLLFVGCISCRGPDKLKIRVGIFSTAIIMWLIISQLLEGEFIGPALITLLVAWFYIRFLDSYKKDIQKAVLD